MRRLLQKGFSLVEVTIILGILGGVGAMMMQLTKNSTTLQSEVMSSSEYNDLKSEVDLILNDVGACTASFKGVTFKGASIQATPVTVELWTGDQTGNRTRKRYSVADPKANKAGKLAINTMEISMPDYAGGANFNRGTESFRAEFSVTVSKTVNGKPKKFPEIKKPLTLTFSTDASGESTIESCVTAAGSSGSKTITLAITQGSGHEGQTGTEACHSVGATCAYVQSTNYISDDSGCTTNPAFCMRACATFYNKSLPGVINGNGRDNIHSCDAKVGQFETYSDGGIGCSAYFHVFCNK